VNGKTLRSLVYLVIFAVVTLSMSYVLAVTITNGSVGSTQTYQAAFTDATGLLKGDDVRIAGVRVGQIKKSPKVIMPTSKDYAKVCGGPRNESPTADVPTTTSTTAGPGSTSSAASSARPASQDITVKPCALVTFGLDKSYPLRSTATASLKYRNLVGQRYLEIDERPGDGTVEPTNHLMPLQVTFQALDLTQLFDGFRPLFQALDPQQINQVSYEIVAALQGEGTTLDTLLTNTGSLSTTIASQDAAIGSLITNLNGVLGTVDARDSELTNLVDQLQRLTTGLAGDRDAIASSLSNVNLLAVSTAKLVAGIRPYLPSDLSQLSAVANTLDTTTTTNDQGKTQNELDELLDRFPSKITAITRTATYGGYFNFYLCQANVTVGGIKVSVTNNNTKVCAAS